MRCDESGFTCQFDIYTGKLQEKAEKNLGERVVKLLSESLFGKNHQLFMDNFFTSYNLFSFLKTKSVFACGTVNMTRKNLPENFLVDKKLKRGQFDWFVSNDEITYLKWKDKRCVTVLSALENPIESQEVERKERDGNKIKVSCPKAIIDYRKNMGFVDHFDHLKSLYEIDRKSRKWWHRIFFHFLDVSTINAFILHQMLFKGSGEKITVKDFRREIIRGLMSMGNEVIPRKRTASKITGTIKKHKVHIPEEKRLQGVAHIPVKCKPRRCGFCSTKAKPHTTRIMCQTCNVGLCMYQKDATCFQKFHSK